MARSLIRSLLNAHVQSIPDLPPLQLENTPSIGRTGQPFSRLTLLPATTIEASAGLIGQNKVSGLLQVDLFYPENLGTAAAEAMADTVAAAFPRGLRLNQGDTYIHFGPPTIGAGYIFAPFYCLPVTVDWWAVVPAS